MIHQLTGHQGEITCSKFEFTGQFCATASIDKTCKLWDIGSGQCVKTFDGQQGEVLDLCFNSTGTKLATASSDSTAKVYQVDTSSCIHTLKGMYALSFTSSDFSSIGHDGEVTRVSFNPQGTKILTTGFDSTARLWDTETGETLELLEGHSDEIFSCAFNYEGDTIITASKDNTCIIWRDELTWK